MLAGFAESQRSNDDVGCGYLDAVIVGLVHIDRGRCAGRLRVEDVAAERSRLGHDKRSARVNREIDGALDWEFLAPGRSGYGRGVGPIGKA